MDADEMRKVLSPLRVLRASACVLWFWLRSWEIRGGLIHAEARRRGGGKIVNNSVKPLFKRRRAKVDKEADGQIHEPKVRQELFAVDRCKLFHGLEFHDDASFNQQIGSEAFFEHHSIVFKADDLLPFDP